MAARHCSDCGRRMEPFVPRKRNASGDKVCPACADRTRGGLVNAQPNPIHRAPFPLRATLQTEAHDSSQDPTGVFHCPFCGSGQLVQSSNGSTECIFCKNFFTVQKQPQFSGIPQTQDGMQMGPPRPEQDRIDDYGSGQDPNLPNPVPADASSQQPEMIVEGSFLTAKGAELNRDAFIRHLAIAYAPDRETVLAQVRASRQKESK